MPYIRENNGNRLRGGESGLAVSKTTKRPWWHWLLGGFIFLKLPQEKISLGDNMRTLSLDEALRKLDSTTSDGARHTTKVSVEFEVNEYMVPTRTVLTLLKALTQTLRDTRSVTTSVSSELFDVNGR